MRNRAWLVAGQTLLGAGLLAAWFWVVDLRAVGETLGHARWGYILVAAGVSIVSTWIRAARWRAILRPVARVPRLDVWLIGFASSLINFVIPIRSGELARGLFLKQRHGVAVSASLPTVAVDRSLDLLAVVLIGALGGVSGLIGAGPLSGMLWAGAALLAAFAGLIVLTIFWRGGLLRAADRLLPGAASGALRTRILGILDGVISGFASVGGQPRRLVPLLGLALAASLVDASVFYLIFLSLGPAVPFLIVLTGYALFVITFILPGAPGYIGSMEAFGSLVFTALGVAEANAASMIVLFHALNAVVLGLAGGLAFWILGLRPSQTIRSVMRGSATGPAVVDPGPGDLL